MNLAFLVIPCLAASLTGADLPARNEASGEIRKFLTDTVAREKIPGLVGAITSSKGVLALGSAGVRKHGNEVAISDADLIHLGSCTKAMTSSMIAILVKEGALSWDSSLIEALPDLKGAIDPSFYSVTLWQLLTHRGGVPANAKDWWSHGRIPLIERRITLLKENLRLPAAHKKGSYLYSNLGYMIAGCIAERATGLTWEAMMQKRLFTPLGMTSAGFGSPGALGGLEQPWGHRKLAGKWSPRQFDNAPSLGPAGRIHCSMSDWARFLGCFLPAGERLGLGPDGLKKLVTPIGQYAGGWIVAKRPWAQGAVLTHSGSNTMWYATVWLAPNLDRGFVVATNCRDERSHEICDQVIGRLIRINQSSVRAAAMP